MFRFALICIGTASVLNVLSATNENVTIEEIYEMASNILNATEQWQHDLKSSSVEGRKSKLLPFGLLPFQALWGFGGLHALGILFAIKFKIIIVAAIVAFSVYYYLKYYAHKKCHGDYFREGGVYPDHSYSGSSYYSSPMTSYSSPFSGDIISSGHPSIEPYSAYHDSSISSYALDHHDHHNHHNHHNHHDYHEHDFHDHHNHHDHHEYDQFLHGSSHDSPSSGSDMPPMASGDIKDAPNDSGLAMSPTYRRVGKHRKRRAARPQVDFIDFGEMAFRFLGVDSEGCRKRFVCELDFRAQTNPITRLAFSFIGRNFFERYRDSDETVAKLQKFSDCAKIYRDCEDAEKYNDIADADADEVKNEEKEKTQDGNNNKFVDLRNEQNASERSPNDDMDENEGAGDSQPNESDVSNSIRRKLFQVVI